MASSSSPVKRLDQVLQILDRTAGSNKTDKIQQLAQEASRNVEELKQELKRTSLIRDLALLVGATEWGKVTQQLQNNVPAGADRENVVKKVVALIYDDDFFIKSREIIIWWLFQLAPELQPVAFQAIYQHLKSTDNSKMHLILLLMESITKYSILVQDDVQAQLKNDCDNIVILIVEGIKKKDFTACNELHRLKVLDFFMPQILSAFDMTKLENVLFLIYFSEKIYGVSDGEVCHFIVTTLLKTLEENLLLDSEHALHLWAHVKSFLLHVQRNNYWYSTETLMLLRATLEKLDPMKDVLLLHYQKYVEDNEKLKIIDLLDQNRHLESIVPQFVSWYLSEESTRNRNQSRLIALTRSGMRYGSSYLMLEHVHEELIKLQQTNTFEAFCLFNEFYKQGMLLRNVPECVRLLLTCSDQNELLVVNKWFLGRRLCVQDKNPHCFVDVSTRNKKSELCSAKVHRVTDRTSFSFKSGNACWEMDAQPDGMVRAVSDGTQWMIKPFDDQHIKIFTKDGMAILQDFLFSHNL